MNRSLKDSKKFTTVLAPVSVTASVSGTGVDTSYGESLTFLVNVGDFSFSGSNKLDIVVQEADVDVDGSYADCVDADIFDAEDGANGIAKALDSTDDKETVHAVHYKGNARYVRIRLEETGTVTCPIGVVAVQGHLKANPPA